MQIVGIHLIQYIYLMSTLPLNTSYKHHFIVGLIVGIWLVAFLVLIAPFDIAELPFLVRLELLPVYGIITLACYLMLIPVQNWVFKQKKKWTLFLEVALIVVFNMLTLLGSFLYYKTAYVNGDYGFSKFTLEVYMPIFLIQLPILIFSRWYLNKKISSQKSDKIILTGENKMDILQMRFSDLICISSADNYVEISYLANNVLREKLLRTTLKKIHLQQPQLVKTHRSHIINPIHFKEWKGSNTIILTQKEVPVSKNYKKSILALPHSSQKTKDSSLIQ